MSLASDAARVARTLFKEDVADPQAIGVVWSAEDAPSPDAAIWARFVVELGDVIREEIGSPASHRLVGAAAATFYGPLVGGTDRLLELADIFAGKFRSKRVKPVAFRQSMLGEPRREAPWWVVPVVVPFVAQEVI